MMDVRVRSPSRVQENRGELNRFRRLFEVARLSNPVRSNDSFGGNDLSNRRQPSFVLSFNQVTVSTIPSILTDLSR
jgi:hypothetical protein